MLLFYIRHGDPIYDPDSLTPLGHRQAEAVAKRLALYGIDRIFVSSSTRARQTAQPTCELLKKEPTVLDWCNEGIAWHEFTCNGENGGRTWLYQDRKMRELLVSEEMRKLDRDWATHPKIEEVTRQGVERIRKETDAFLQELGFTFDPAAGVYRATRPNNDRIALFAHEGFGKAFLSTVLDIPYPTFATRFELSHSGMTVIEFTDGAPARILTYSSDSHLYREGLPTCYQNRIYF